MGPASRCTACTQGAPTNCRGGDRWGWGPLGSRGGWAPVRTLHHIDGRGTSDARFAAELIDCNAPSRSGYVLRACAREASKTVGSKGLKMIQTCCTRTALGTAKGNEALHPFLSSRSLSGMSTFDRRGWGGCQPRETNPPLLAPSLACAYHSPLQSPDTSPRTCMNIIPYVAICCMNMLHHICNMTYVAYVAPICCKFHA